ncbi:MAG: MATE family efflux transporter [Xanthomonadales bacterium]|nr:MATE family efflux transporter [Xanthomonadales bacterium]MDH3922988.1 MATE family efflux transporter [Xanthomonadales bacterium]MDH3999650.1 MATE family efflux transporter [Xanthomonadales bacterium]
MRLATPVIIGQLAVFSMNFVDTVMAGRLPEKEIALAALGIGGAVWSSMLMFILGTLMVVQPSVAQLDGAQMKSEAASQTRQAFWIALALGVPFALVCTFSEALLTGFGIDPVIVPEAAGYLRAMAWGAPALSLVFLLRFFSEGTGNTTPTMLYGVAGALLNIPLNYVLMYGKLGFPALGTVGCGYATSIVIWLQLLLLFLYIHKHRHYQPFALMSYLESPSWPKIWSLLKVGLPIAVAIFVEGSLFVGAALLIGRLGPIPAAAHLIAINFSALMFMIPIGLASAISIRVGNAIGRGELDSARYTGIIGVVIVLGFQTVSATCMFLFPELIVSIYTDDLVVAPLAVSLLFYAAIFQYPDGLQMVAAGALRGYKDTRKPMLYMVISFWIVGMTLGYNLTFNRGMGPAGMWIGMIAGLTIASALMLRRFQHTSKKRIRDQHLSI